jgi:hypothetical protein
VHGAWLKNARTVNIGHGYQACLYSLTHFDHDSYGDVWVGRNLIYYSTVTTLNEMKSAKIVKARTYQTQNNRPSDTERTHEQVPKTPINNKTSYIPSESASRGLQSSSTVLEAPRKRSKRRSIMVVMMKERGAVSVSHRRTKNFDAMAFGEICLGIEMALILVRWCAVGFVVLEDST